MVRLGIDIVSRLILKHSKKAMQAQFRARMGDLTVDAVMHIDFSREGRIQEKSQLHRQLYVLSIDRSKVRRDLVHSSGLELGRLQKGRRFDCLFMNALCHFQLDEFFVGSFDRDARDLFDRER